MGEHLLLRFLCECSYIFSMVALEERKEETGPAQASNSL